MTRNEIVEIEILVIISERVFELFCYLVLYNLLSNNITNMRTKKKYFEQSDVKDNFHHRPNRKINVHIEKRGAWSEVLPCQQTGAKIRIRR